ncbi:MAG TPA: hypothetical protein V6D11_14850 [Waterburya sp.]|jgi:hypothetical protein
MPDSTAVDDSVHNQAAIAERLRTESSLGTTPLFFIGSSPSAAKTIINPDYPAYGVMISRPLLHRKSDFEISPLCEGRWIFDAFSFTEIETYGEHTVSIEHRAALVKRWSLCGDLLAAVTQDYMCEPFILERSKARDGGKTATVEDHQRLTIERYDQLLKATPTHLYTMPVLQGYRTHEYLAHLRDYGERLKFNAWVGVGSVCRRNGNPLEVLDILASIHAFRPDLRLHGFGLKQLAVENPQVRSHLYSCDSGAATYSKRFGDPRSEEELNHEYQQRFHAAVTDSVQKRVPLTAGAGNGQGRKPQWNRPTKAIRVPAEFADKLIQLAKEWDSEAQATP